MKTLLLACLAGALTASPLRAQDAPTQAASSPSPSPAPASDTAAQADQLLKNPFVQQLLHTVVQKALDLQGSAADGNSLDLKKTFNSLLAGLMGDSPEDAPPAPASDVPVAPAPVSGFTAYSEARLASEAGQRRFDSATRTWVTRPPSDAERAELMSRFQQDYARLAPAERAQWEAAADGGIAVTLRKWGGALGSNGGLRTSGLKTGGLRTGSLSGDPLPARDFVTPAASVPATTALPKDSALVASAPVTANTPPADPDDAMRRWNRQIDGQYANEQEARSAAVRQYPDLVVSNSAFNKQFLARYQQYRQADPFGFLRGPGWPMKLAIFTEGDLRRQQSGTAERP